MPFFRLGSLPVRSLTPAVRSIRRASLLLRSVETFVVPFKLLILWCQLVEMLLILMRAAPLRLRTALPTRILRARPLSLVRGPARTIKVAWRALIPLKITWLPLSIARRTIIRVKVTWLPVITPGAAPLITPALIILSKLRTLFIAA